MGILYNRFTEQSLQSLIPYSNQSNILTYLVPSSFKGSSSTIWGDDYPMPLVRYTSSSGIWQYSSADDSVYLQGHYTITPGEGLSKFTVYMVVEWNVISGTTNPPCFALIKGNYYDRIYGKYGENVRALLDGATSYASVLTPEIPSYLSYHVYAFRRCVGKFCHVIDDQNLVSISAPNYTNITTKNFAFRNIVRSDTYEYSANVKFLSIVNGEESDATILNNVNNIRIRLNLP